MSNLPVSEMTAHSGTLTPGNVPARAVPIDREAVAQALGLNLRDAKTQALFMLAERYELDPLRKELVLIQSSPYVTRDGYLTVAHRSGVFNGMEVLEEAESDSHYTAKVAVWRRDMSRPFTFTGRFSKAKPMAKEYGPEMALKVAEMNALRRAFNVSGQPVEPDMAPEDFDGESRAMPLQSEVSMACRDAGLSDEERHDLVLLLTKGRTKSSRDLTVEEAREVVVAARQIKEGTTELVYNDGAESSVVVLRPLKPADDFDRESIRHGLERLGHDERADYGAWWAAQGLPKIEALSAEQALIAFDELQRRAPIEKATKSG